MTLDEDHPGMFHAAIEMSLVPIVLADPHQHDCPIVFANGAFCEMTGYDLAEIVGRNCRFLQGPATGEILRDLVLGRTPFVDVAPMSAERFDGGLLTPEFHIV